MWRPLVFDYFVCSAKTCNQMWQGSGIYRHAPFGTHRAMFSRMAAQHCRVLVPKLRTVADIPQERTKVGFTWEEALAAAKWEQPGQTATSIGEEVLADHPRAEHMQSLDVKLR